MQARVVSQPSMRGILRTGTCLFGLAAAFVACSQSEGGRCQVDSDCASGLTCKSRETGNGTCEPSGFNPPEPEAALTADASVNRDVAADAPSSADARDSANGFADLASSADGTAANGDGASLSADAANGPDVARVTDVAAVGDAPAGIDGAAGPLDAGGVDGERLDSGAID